MLVADSHAFAWKVGLEMTQAMVPEWVDTKEDATRFTSKTMATYAIGETGEPGLEVEQTA